MQLGRREKYKTEESRHKAQLRAHQRWYKKNRDYVSKYNAKYYDVTKEKSSKSGSKRSESKRSKSKRSKSKRSESKSSRRKRSKKSKIKEKIKRRIRDIELEEKKIISKLKAV